MHTYEPSALQFLLLMGTVVGHPRLSLELLRHPNTDARLSLARLCALTGRVDQAREWFEKARHVLDEQGARPLRAITDFDEAWMEVRRGRDGDRERALALLDAARGPFEHAGLVAPSRRVACDARPGVQRGPRREPGWSRTELPAPQVAFTGRSGSANTSSRSSRPRIATFSCRTKSAQT
jgi:hypothetical protein